MLSALSSFFGYGQVVQHPDAQPTMDGSSGDDPSLWREEQNSRTYYELFEDYPVDWDAVKSRLKAYPSEASITPYFADVSPLCAAIESDAPLDVIRILLNLAPDSARHCDGVTPLFRAVMQAKARGDPEVVRMVLEAHPAAARLTTISGDLPLHVARDVGTTRLLLGAFPAAVGHRNKQGCLPLHRVAYAGESDVGMLRVLIDEGEAQKLGGSHGYGGLFVKSNKGNTVVTAMFDAFVNGPGADEMRSVSDLSLLSPLAWRKWDKLSIILEAASLAMMRDRMFSADKLKFRILHAVIELGAPDLVVRHAFMTNHHQCLEQDELGRSALCIAVTRKETPTYIIQMLLEKKNGGDIMAGRMDKSGRLPLHYAVASGRPYDDAMKAIINAAPQALEIRDGITHLYPFMMAGVGKRSDVDLVYRLVTEAPGLLRPLGTQMQVERKNLQISRKSIFPFLEGAPMWILFSLVPVAINIFAKLTLQKFRVKLS